MIRSQRPWELLVNPKARGGAGIAEAVLDVLRRHGVDAQIRSPASAEETRKMAREMSRREVIVAALGGDGTANDVGSQLVDGQAWLASLPGGTENLLCRAAGAPLDSRRAVESLIAGRPRRWDVGLVNGRVFLGFAGIGFDGEVCRRVNGPLKEKFGKSAYLAATLIQLARRPVLYKLRTHALSYSGISEAVISNIPLFGGGLKVNPGASPWDGALDLAAFPWKGYRARLRQLLSLLFERPGHPRLGIVRSRIQHAAVEDGGQIAVQIDGDPVVMTNPEISIRPACLWVLEAGIPGQGG